VNLRFWQKPNSWPRDPRGYNFLARAFDLVGNVVFGETWKGVDEQEIVDPLPQSVREATTQQRRRAHLILKQHFPDRPKPTTRPLADKNKPVYTFTEQEWATAYQFAQEAFQHEQTTAEQLKHIQQVIAEACEKAILALATRNKTTGKMSPLDASVWNAEFKVWGQRFNKCMIDRKNPLRGGVGGRDYEWIFITTDSLQPFLETLRKEKPTASVILTSSQEKKCRKWLETQMQDQKHPSKAKDEYRKEAKALFSVGTRAFDRAWTNAISSKEALAWSKPGRKPKSPRVIDTPPND